jgi:transposase
MIQITPQHRLMIAVDAVDFRRGIDSLIALSRCAFNQNPFDGYLFAFRNRRGTSIKLLNYDGNGFWLCQKRFSSGKLAWWPRNETEAQALQAVELLIILQQGRPEQTLMPLPWRPLPQ